MGVARPTELGGTIAVSDSAALAALDARGLPLGTRVLNLDVGSYFALLISDAPLVPDQVVEVSGITGSRWILDIPPLVGVESVTGDGVDNTDPRNPVIDLTNTITAGMMQADSVTTTAIYDEAVTSPKLSTALQTTITDAATDADAALAAIAALAPIASSGSASDLSSGTIPDARMPDLTGDVTTAQGTVATSIASGAVTASKLAVDSVTTTAIADGNVTAGKLAATAVTPGSYTLASITVDQQGRITAASSNTDGGITQLTGDVTAGPGSGSQAATVANLPTGVPAAGSILATAIVAPSTPAAGKGQLYVDSTSKNICVKDEAGVVKHGVQTRTAVASTFLTAISDAGGVSAAQPSASDVSGLATVATSGSASDLGSGTLPAGRLPALTGDVTSSAGSAATTLAAGSASALNSGTLNAARLPALTGDVTSSAGSAVTTLTAGSASNLNSGTLNAARLPALTGDVTSSAGSATTTLGNIPTGTTMAGKVTATAIAAPSTPASGKGEIYEDSTSKNICLKDDAGVVKHGVQTVSATASQWIRAIDDAGAGTKSQPAFSDVSGSVAASQMPALTGDVTTSAGAVATTLGNIGSTVTVTKNSVAVSGAAAQNLASTLTFPADGQNIGFDGVIIGPNATNTWSIEPNTLATNQVSQVFGSEDGTAQNFQDTGRIYIADATATSTVYFWGKVVQISGVERQFTIHVIQKTGSARFGAVTSALWNVTTTITALRLHSSAAAGLAIGTTLRTWVID